MRNFYIFEINTFMKQVTKDNPYDLFHTLESIYYQRLENLETTYNFFRQIACPIKIKDLDIQLFKAYKENYFYTKYKNVHSMHDVYRNEDTVLTLYKTYIKLQTNVVKPRFIEELKKNHNYFVCDFEEKDYFWLESLEPIPIG